MCKYSVQSPGKIPDWTERHMLEIRDMIGVLSPIAMGTDILQGAKYATASYYMPTLQTILQSLHPQTPVYVCSHTKDCGKPLKAA